MAFQAISAFFRNGLEILVTETKKLAWLILDRKYRGGDRAHFDSKHPNAHADTRHALHDDNSPLKYTKGCRYFQSLQDFLSGELDLLSMPEESNITTQHSL